MRDRMLHEYPDVLGVMMDKLDELQLDSPKEGERISMFLVLGCIKEGDK